MQTKLKTLQIYWSFKSILKEELDTSADLYILDWWKINSSIFPILSIIARELLVVLCTFLKSASSKERRVFDPYCSSLSHQKVEACIFTHGWLKDSSSPSLLDLCMNLRSLNTMTKQCLQYISSNKFYIFLQNRFLNKKLAGQPLFLLKHTVGFKIIVFYLFFLLSWTNSRL